MLFEVIHHGQPEFCTLILANPYTKDVLAAIHPNPQNHIRMTSIRPDSDRVKEIITPRITLRDIIMAESSRADAAF